MGVSTRSLSLISKGLLGVELSHSQVSKHASKLTKAVEAWRTRPIEDKIKYLYMDGTNFKMRIANKVELVTVIGVLESGHKQVLCLQAGDKESASSWRQIFKDLKARGLKKGSVTLGIMDGLPGLEGVFKEHFSKSSKVY